MIQQLNWTTRTCVTRESQPKQKPNQHRKTKRTSPVCLATRRQRPRTFPPHSLLMHTTPYMAPPRHVTKTHLDIRLNQPSRNVRFWGERLSVPRTPASACQSERQIKIKKCLIKPTSPLSTFDEKGPIFERGFVHPTDLLSPVLLPCWSRPRGASGRPCFCQPASRKTLHHH